jgi:hypothetical protein
MTETNKTNTGTQGTTQDGNAQAGAEMIKGIVNSPEFKKVMAAQGVGGATFTNADADYLVQQTYQQLLGRNATGQQYAKALQVAMSQDQNTNFYARQQAISNYIQQMPEYQMELEDKYMEATYNAVAASARKVQA